MPDEPSLPDLLHRIRAGDAAAAEALVKSYEPHIRRYVRVRLTDPGLRRTLDSMDVCQSVFANFFLRVALGQYDLNDPKELIRLLAAMAKNKVVDRHRRERAARRGGERKRAGDEGLAAVADPGGTPSLAFALEELRDKVRRSMTEDERRVADGRAAGREWAEIAAEAGEAPEALRKRYERRVNELRRQHGIGGDGDA